MALMKKTIDMQELGRFFLKKKRTHSGEYSYERLVLCLGELKSKGYFFHEEWNGDEEHCMEFRHFLTKRRLFLHLKKMPYTHKQGKGLMMFLDDNAVLQCHGAEQSMLHFERILASCGLYLREKELYKIYDTALREDNTDSLLTVLAKNRYMQKRVGRTHTRTERETKAYWVGEFLDEKAEPREACYFYLVQVRTEVKKQIGTDVLSHMLSPEWYLMKSREPVGEIYLDNGMMIGLGELEWLNRPFTRYYDLPVAQLSVYEGEKERFLLNGENLNKVLSKLYQDGYRFRHERIYPAISELCALTEEQVETINEEIGLNAEYIHYGLNRIETEFVNPNTRERKVLIVDPAEIRIERNNAGCEFTGIYTSWFRFDQACSPLYYAEAKCENDLSNQVAEIVFPTPVFLTLLEQYNLITAEQIKICRLMGCNDFRNWFFDLYSYMPCESDEEPETEISEKEKEKAGRIRRIARSLNYEFVGVVADSPHTKIEIYADKDRRSAIYLIERGGEYKAKYVDEYMDVREALRMYMA